MGKNKIFSAIMILAAVFTVASGQCYPGKVVGLNKGDTICATANCLGIDCDVMIKYLQVHYHAQIVSGCLNDSALIVTLPTKAAIDSLIAQKNVAAPKKAKAKAKTRGQKNSPATEFEKITGPGPAQWINYGVDPWRGDPLAAWCMLGFSQYISALDSMKAAFARDDYVRDSISNGKYMNEMVSGHEGVIGKGRGVIFHPKNPKLVIYGIRFRIKINARPADIFKPDNCDNWCWWWVDLPPEPSTPPSTTAVAPPQAKPPENIPAPPQSGIHWFDDDSATTPTATPTLPPMPTDVPSPVKRKMYGDVFGWLTHDFPWPLWYGGNNSLGGMGNLFWPVGQMSGFGFGIKANGYQGWGPTPVPDTAYSDVYAGFMAGIGPVLDLRTARTRTTIAARGYFQGDWLWSNGAGKPTYQLTWLAAPELTFYAANQNWSRWTELWIGWRQDLQPLFPNYWISRKVPFSLDKKPIDETVGEWGLRWYCIPLSKANVWTLGVMTQGDHMNMDHRWEIALGPTLRYKDWRMDIKCKETFRSDWYLQNGGSLGICINYDATPKSQASTIHTYVDQ